MAKRPNTHRYPLTQVVRGWVILALLPGQWPQVMKDRQGDTLVNGGRLYRTRQEARDTRRRIAAWGTWRERKLQVRKAEVVLTVVKWMHG